MKTFKMTPEEYIDLCNDYVGMCVKCESERECCEPDARNYMCDVCESKSVFGLEELNLMGMIEFE